MSGPSVAVWSPRPPSPSGIADYVAEQLPALGAHLDLRWVGREDEAAPADLDVYHLGNSPAHAFVYRAALRRPGVVVLHDWSLHQLVLRETVERGDVSAYLRETCKVGPVMDFQGLGFLHGLRLNKPAKDVQKALLARDILAGTAGDPAILRLLPAFILKEEHIDRLRAALEDL